MEAGQNRLRTGKAPPDAGGEPRDDDRMFCTKVRLT